MQLIDFVDACDVRSKKDMEIFELLCYYQTKESGAPSFNPKKMRPMYEESGIAMPDPVKLKNEAIRCGSFRPYGIEGTLKFSKDRIRLLEKEYGHLWENIVAPKAPGAPKGTAVRLMDFADACGMHSKDANGNLELLCYYLAKERGEKTFHVRGMGQLYEDAGLAVPDIPSLEKHAKRHDSFKTIGIDGSVVFVPEVFASLDLKYRSMWDNASVRPAPTAVAPTASEVIDEDKFCGRKDGFDRLIRQINSSYRDGSFDACAAVMRRLLEASLIFAFQSNGMEKEITDGNGYADLHSLVRKAAGCAVLGLSGRTDVLTDISIIGDYSGRGPTYTFGANDINSVRIAYREVLEALFSASKLL